VSLTRQFRRFTLVGAAGFAVDVAVLYLALTLGLGLYSGRLVSFLAAATATWLGNRHFTFTGAAPPRHRAHGEWFRYLLAMAAGGLLNYGVYAGLVFQFMLFRSQPWLAVAAGTGAGMLLNFALARRILYRPAISNSAG
jgi:putative flippase GtrA